MLALNPTFTGPDTLLAFDEIISPTAISVGQKLLVPVSLNLTQRRIYCFIDTKSSGDFVLYARVRTYNQLQEIDQFRADLCSFAVGTIIPNRSLISCFGVGGSAVGDSIVLQLAAPFNTALTSVVCQPLRIDSTITHVSFEIEALAGLVSGFRAFLAVISSKS